MTGTSPALKQPTLKDELAAILNKYSAEGRSNTPDFILAQFLIGCLNSFDRATNLRSDWYNPRYRVQPEQERE